MKSGVREAVKQNGYALKHAAPHHKADREIVLEAVKHKWMSLDYAAPELKTDRQFMLEPVKQNGKFT